VDSAEVTEVGKLLNGPAFRVVGQPHRGAEVLVGLAHFLTVVLRPLRVDLAALVCGRFVVVYHHQP
jgi:hypothetical protein